MKLNKYKLGELIKQVNEKNIDNKYKLKDVKGISIKKEFIETKADMSGVSLKPYLIVKPDYFAYVTVTSRNGEKITIAHNDTENTYIVSSSYIVFEVCRKDILDTDYLFMYFNRFEFDRYSRFNSWGSARETFSWDEMCDIDIELPNIEIQQKYVDIYKAMLDNQKSYEKGLDNLKLICDRYIDSQIPKDNYHKLGNYIKLNNKRNTDGKYNEKNIMGFNDAGDFIKPMRVFSGDINKFRIISKGDFVYNPRIPTDTYPIALNNSDNSLLVSPAYVTFNIKNNKELLEDYLIMISQRKTFSKEVLFNTWGSSTPYLRHEDLCDIEIPIPSIEVQNSLALIYKLYNIRRIMNENLKNKLKEICPILIKGSIEEAKLS